MIWRALIFIVLALPVWSAECYDDDFNGASYTVCRATFGVDDVRLFHLDQSGEPYGQFYSLANDLRDQDQRLVFAMNAGMYHDDLSPVGLYIEAGIETMRVVTSAGPGNFGMLPNGVFCISPDGMQVLETLEYVAARPKCTYATQSGPMLVIDGAYHPRFYPDSTYNNIRNGVAVIGDIAHFVISNDRVNFYTFAQYFKDRLRAQNALFLDGRISRLYAPDLNRYDLGWSVGPMVGVVKNR